MSDFQVHPTAGISGPAPDWDEAWGDSPIPHDKSEWRAVIAEISQSPALAERLVDHGWTVAEFGRALQDSRYLIELGRLAAGPRLEANFVVLADAVAQIHHHRSSLALELRRHAMQDLALPILDESGSTTERGWTYDRIGALVGLTKQRARDIAKPKDSGGIPMRKTRAWHRSQAVQVNANEWRQVSRPSPGQGGT